MTTDSMCTKSCRWFFSFIPLGFVSKPDIVSLSLSFPVSTFSCLTKEKWKKKKRERPFLDCCLRVYCCSILRRERREVSLVSSSSFLFFFLSCPFLIESRPTYISLPRESTLLVACCCVNEVWWTLPLWLVTDPLMNSSHRRSSFFFFFVFLFFFLISYFSRRLVEPISADSRDCLSCLVQ